MQIYENKKKGENFYKTAYTPGLKVEETDDRKSPNSSSAERIKLKRPTVLKEITEYLRNLFLCAKVPKLQVALSDLWDQVDYLRTGKTAQSNVRRLIKEHLNTEPTRGRYKLYVKGADTYNGATTVLHYDKNGTFYTFNASDFLTPTEMEMFNN